MPDLATASRANDDVAVPQNINPGIEDEVDAEIQRVIPQGFTVDSADAAAWVVRKIVSAREYREQVKNWAEVECRRAGREEQRLMYLFGEQLRRWTQVEVEKLKGRRKSLALPSGSVGFKAVPTRVIVQDEALVLRWARRACPSAVVTSERLLKTPLSAHFQKTGEVPEGIEIVPPREEFFVR